ncbi:hypothetical protein C8R47DRAFT_973780, partial [Mycena vitilis]
MRTSWTKLERRAYAERFVPDHPVHGEARAAEAAYVKAVIEAKAAHWVEWLESITDLDVWDVHQLASAEPSDGGAATIPTLERRHPGSNRVETAETNEKKTQWLQEEFFPPRMPVSSVPADAEYPPPAWAWKPVSDEIIRRAIGRMKPYKATLPDTPPNCVFQECANLLVPFLGPIYRSLDELEHFPDHWAALHILVLRKPGKGNYTAPGAHRPIALTDGWARVLYAAKTLQCVSEAEIAGILPNNQYG